MDTMTATKASERATELQRQIVVLQATKQQNERGLAGERSTLRQATESRAKLVEELVGADAATTAWADVEIDKLDSTIRMTERRIQSYEMAITRINGHIVRLSAELAEVTRIVEQAKREQGLRALEIQLQEDRHTVEEALAALRLALTALNLTASQGVERYGVAAQNLVTPILEALGKQHNPESFGWRYSGPNYGNFQFTVRPMVKDTAKR